MPPKNTRPNRRNRRPIRLLNFTKPNSKEAIQHFLQVRHDTIAQGIKKSTTRPESSLSKSLFETNVPWPPKRDLSQPKCDSRNLKKDAKLQDHKKSPRPESNLSKSLFEATEQSREKKHFRLQVDPIILNKSKAEPESSLSKSLRVTSNSSDKQSLSRSKLDSQVFKQPLRRPESSLSRSLFECQTKKQAVKRSRYDPFPEMGKENKPRGKEVAANSYMIQRRPL